MVRGSLLLGGYVANLLFLQRLFGVTSSDLLFQYQRKFTSTWLDCSLLVFVYFLSSAKNFRFFPHVNSLLETTLVSDRFADHFRLDISFFSLSSVSYSTTQTTPELKKINFLLKFRVIRNQARKLGMGILGVSLWSRDFLCFDCCPHTIIPVA